jgi:hypothetical protein
VDIAGVSTLEIDSSHSLLFAEQLGYIIPGDCGIGN